MRIGSVTSDWVRAMVLMASMGIVADAASRPGRELQDLGIDANNNGVAERQEVEGYVGRFDRNKDGVLSPDENWEAAVSLSKINNDEVRFLCAAALSKQGSSYK